MLFFFLVLREIDRGPETMSDSGIPTAPAIERGRETTEDYLNHLPVGQKQVG